MKRSGPLKRGKPLRSRSQLKVGKRLPPRSAKAIDRDPERDACRTEVLRRAGNVCQYAPLFSWVPCGFYPWAGRPDLEVDELRGGGQRCTEQYDPDQCRATCPVHHDCKTADKRNTLRRLAQLEGRT